MQPERKEVIYFYRCRRLETVRTPLAVTRHHLVRNDIVAAFHLDGRELHERIAYAILRVTEPQRSLPQVGIELVAGIVGTFAHAVAATGLHMEPVQKIVAVAAGIVTRIPFQVLQRLEFFLFEEERRTDKVILVYLVSGIHVVMENRLEILHGTEFLVVVGTRLVGDRDSHRVHPSQACFPGNRSRRNFPQFMRRRRRKKQFFARRVLARRAVHAAQRNIAQDAPAHAKAKPGIPFHVERERRIGGTHRTDGIVTSHALVNKVAVVDILDKRSRKAVVANVAGTGRHRLVDRRVRLFFRKAQLVAHVTRYAAVIICIMSIHVTHPGMLHIRGIKRPALVLQKMLDAKMAAAVFRRLRPCKRAQRIGPFLPKTVAAAFRKLFLYAFARAPTVAHQAESRSGLSIGDFVLDGFIRIFLRGIRNPRIAHVKVAERAPQPLQVFCVTERLVTFLLDILHARHTNHAHVARNVARLVDKRKLCPRRIPVLVFSLAVTPQRVGVPARSKARTHTELVVP